ncbi:LysR substrate-binding domain-containing protein [Simiduia aestuariiviva]|uniref:DNA-binding transcriptional LysR family regulator n=1 Tax=Simiduia aestuariiviva TaxID=1510459 RepID=A0A839UU81_9GAMM|nr:DNA-binding transcriptional LysR family regulator [Simiduia aestuariiviva]
MNLLTLEALHVLDAIDRKGSFAAAALELHKVPSALSYTVKQLEDYLQLQLFDRSGQRAVMTEAGRQVLKRARRLLDGAEQLTVEARQLATGWEPRLRLVVESILPMAPLWPAIARFAELQPNVEIDVREEALSGSWEALADQRADLLIGVSEHPPTDLKVQQSPLGSLAFRLVCAPTHPLVNRRRKSLAQSDLACHAQIVLRDSARRLAPRSVGLYEVRRQILVDHYYAKEQAIVAGLGFGFLPQGRVQALIEQGALVALDAIKPSYQVPLYLAWDEARSGRGVQWFCEVIQADGLFAQYLESDKVAR